MSKALECLKTLLPHISCYQALYTIGQGKKEEIAQSDFVESQIEMGIKDHFGLDVKKVVVGHVFQEVYWQQEEERGR